jgi:putative hemolysin
VVPMLALEIVIVLVLILINGLLAGSELAIVSSRRARLEAMAEQGSRGARVALRLVEDPGTFLSTVQIGITLVGIVAGAYSGATFADTLGDRLDGYAWIAPNGDAIAIAIVVIVITYLSLVVGELVPKRIALTNPERAAAAVARPMLILSRVSAPAVWLLRHSSDFILGILGLSGERETEVTEEEVKLLIAEGTRTGVFEPEEREMIDGVLRLADRSVRAIMTPRADISWIAMDASSDEILRRLRDERYTQLLVCEDSIDHPVGVIDASDVISALVDNRDIGLRDIVRKAPVIPERTRILDLIEVFRREGEHFAVIVDEYGTTQGVVTSTDVLESIAGDLPDSAEDASPMIVERDDGSWLVDGLLPIDRFEDLVGIRGLRGGGFETVAGLVLDRLGRIPEAGTRMTLDGLTVEVIDMDGRRIDKLLVVRRSEANGSS